MIVFDLEWNSGLYDPIRLDEILQIGAVKVRCPGGPIVDSFNAYIRPQVHKRFSPAAAALPDLALSQAAQMDLPTALAAFLDWCGEDRLFGTWGGGDLAALRQNQTYWKLPDDLPKTYIDLQLAFGRALGCSDNLSLEWAAAYCGAPDIFDPHNALADAVYAWMAARLLTGEELAGAERTAEPAPKGQKALPRRGTPWQGPFESRERALNNRGCRKAVCPRCGAAQRVGQWHQGEDGYYYSRFACAGCGRGYILRLELLRDKGKRLWANSAVYRASGQRRDAYLAAAQSPPIPCRGSKRRRRRGASRG